MKLKEIMESFGRAFIPKKFREPLQNYVLKAGFNNIPYAFFGILFVAALIVTYLVFIVVVFPRIQSLAVYTVGTVTLLFWIGMIGGISVFVMFFIWSYLNLKIYSRTKEMEERLPEYLTVVVTNLKSGMSFDKSLWAAVRPEFGVLAKEITIVSKKVITGNDTSEALSDFANRYESPILRRSMNLIISEIESGGEIASVIERVIINLRKTASLKKEMAASVVSYMIFIGIIVMVISPVLFALANTILKVILSFAVEIAGSGGSSPTGAGSAIFNSLGNLSESGDSLTADFEIFSYIALGVISLFSSMIVSIIEKGDIKGGLKYIPVFISVTMGLFWVFNKVLVALFASLL